MLDKTPLYTLLVTYLMVLMSNICVDSCSTLWGQIDPDQRCSPDVCKVKKWDENLIKV